MTPATVKPGVIVLARHGEPALSRKVRLNAQQYRDFWAQYEVLGLLPGQVPPSALTTYAAGCEVLMASTRLRSVESAQALLGDRAFHQDAVLVEAPLPPPSSL